MTARTGLFLWSAALFLWLLLLLGAFYFDANVHAWVVQNQTPNLRAWMLAISRWGDWPAHVALGLLGALISYLIGDRGWLRIFIAMIIACALAGAAARVIKISVGRARPSVAAEAGWSGPSLRSKNHAFPSGHTAASLAFFAVPCFARRRIGFVFLIVPLVIAASRILLDAHYFSDVVFAGMLGVLSAWLVWRKARDKSVVAGKPTR